MHLSIEAVLKLAWHADCFEVPTGPPSCRRASDDWHKARLAVEGASRLRATPRDGAAKLSASARLFIREGEVDVKAREVSTFRVAAELSEVYLSGGFEQVLHAMLEEAALDSGLTPSEVKHAIDGGLLHARRQREGGAS